MAKVRRTTVRNADQWIANLEPFRTRSGEGGLWGEDGHAATYAGQLPEPYRSEFTSGLVSDGLSDRILYVVYSYSTPIGWMRGDGTRVIPDTKYSVTTTKHQSAVRGAWGITRGVERA